MTALINPTVKKSYQPFTSPAFKGLKCLGGSSVLISKDAQQVIDRLSPSGKASVNNQMSCITKSNVGSVGSHKLYIELTDGLLELKVIKQKKLNQLQIESARELKGLRKPWTGSRISLTQQWSIANNGYTYDELYYSNPVYSYPEEALDRFLLRVAPEFHRMTDKGGVTIGADVHAGAEYVSAIYVTKGPVNQYALIIETQGLPLLSVATRPAPQGFATKYNMVNGARAKETIHTHGEKRWRKKVRKDTELFIKVFANDQRHESELMARYHAPFERSTSRIPLTAKGDSNNFSSEDLKAYGWLVTEDRTLLFQKADKNTVTTKGRF
ncbi:hypothetical protein GCM10009123_12670 [Kangiella japonica]|uniref:Uncharacterized protein n=1 Tax=Kangiella japonica TaxID=647384 RepID=A0ABN0SYJ8_9GAMM